MPKRDPYHHARPIQPRSVPADLDWSDVERDAQRGLEEIEEAQRVEELDLPYTSLDRASEALDVALRDVQDDSGLSEETIYWDILLSVAADCDEETARELCRTNLGMLPDSLTWYGQ